jgi:hypothetical protein
MIASCLLDGRVVNLVIGIHAAKEIDTTNIPNAGTNHILLDGSLGIRKNIGPNMGRRLPVINPHRIQNRRLRRFVSLENSPVSD